MSARNDLKAFVGKLKAATKKAVQQKALRPIAEMAIAIIVKRTRLGYGVESNGAQRTRLKPLSSTWIAARAYYLGEGLLSSLTTPNKSNLTFTGQMLDSMAITRVSSGSILIGPVGYRTDPLSNGKSNEQVANYVAKAGRAFNNLSKPEIQQLSRFYNNAFGDLLRNERLTVVTRGS